MTLALFAASLVLPAAAQAQGSPRDHAAWWIESFGVPSGAEEPLLERARAVFERVSAAADKSGSRYPRLVVVRERPGPLALAIPDGSVVITGDALRLCYGGVPLPAGDARLGFVLGHELSHLARDDFWHAFATAALADSPAANSVKQALAPSLDVAAEEKRRRELEADSFGIVYLAMAGYDTNAVLRDDGAFLQEWAAQARGTLGIRSHPDRAARVALLRAQLRDVADRTELFRFGLRLQQIGRYEDAMLLLEAFRERFPSREVFNALGLCHFQMALRLLAGCSEGEVTRFRLPTLLDPDTLAKRITLRSADEPSCAGSPPFRRHAEEAARALEHAVAKDASYLPARANLASALLLAGEYARALAAADEALRLAPDSTEAANAQALALYLYGRMAGFDTADNALEVLQKLRSRAPRDPATAYNLAAVLEERGRFAAARLAWEEFLGLEGGGLFAAAARRRLGGAPPEAANPSPPPPVPSPIALGAVSPITARRLATLRRSPLVIGRLQGAIYGGKGLRALDLGGSIEMVEEELGAPIAAEDVTRRYGDPLREFGGTGSRILVYRGFACDVVGDRVVRRIYFSP